MRQVVYPDKMWEGNFLIDALIGNTSNIQPKVIHSDTQGQSTALFALSYLFGIELMNFPRFDRVTKAEIYSSKSGRDQLWQRFKRSTRENSKVRHEVACDEWGKTPSLVSRAVLTSSLRHR